MSVFFSCRYGIPCTCPSDEFTEAVRAKHRGIIDAMVSLRLGREQLEDWSDILLQRAQEREASLNMMVMLGGRKGGVKV